MAQYLSPEWFDAVAAVAVGASLPGGVSARVECAATGGPSKGVTGHVILEGGVIREVGVGPCPDVELTLTAAYADAVSLSDGSLEPSVAYMQGRLKTAGDLGKVIELLALTRSGEHHDLRSKIAAITDY